MLKCTLRFKATIRFETTHRRRKPAGWSVLGEFLSILGSRKKLIPSREGNGVVGSQSSSSAIGLQQAVVCLLFLNESLTVFAKGKRLLSSGLWGFC